MPIFDFKCSECEGVKAYVVGGATGLEPPIECPECGATDCMEKQFSAKGVSGEVVGGYAYEYGKKAWKKNKSADEQSRIISGDADPY